MVGDWVTRRIGDLGRVVTGKTPSTKDPDNFGGPYPFITIPDLNRRVRIDSALRSVSEKGANTIRSSLLPAGSVMMSCIATVGKCGITTRPSFTNQQINSVVPNNEVDSLFLYYSFTQMGHELESAGGGGSIYTNVSKSRFSDIEISLPSDKIEQRAIAHILGSLDDKIELNRSTNEILEAMARALFKSWFVDYDPVRAKMDGRWRSGQSLPGMPVHLYDLLPNRLVPSELGEIPEGWEVKTFDETVELIGGGTPKTSIPEYWGNDIPWFSVVDSPREEDIWVLDTEKKITPSGVENSSTQILPVGTTIITARGTVGRVALVGVPMAMNQSCYGLRGKHDNIGFYTYFTIRALVTRLRQRSHGSVFDTITRATFRGVRVALATAPTIEFFENTVTPLLEQIRKNISESRTLASIRDTLLPKLISGNMRIKNSEKLIKEVEQ